MNWYLTALVVHITCAAIWIGGNVFFVSLIRLLGKKSEFRELRGEIIYAYVMAYRLATYILFSLILLSGLLLIYERGLLNSLLWKSSLGLMALMKLSVFTALMGLQMSHDFFFGPKAFTNKDGHVALEERHRRANRIVGQVVFLVSFFMLIVGIFLSRGFSFF
ncbi:MAG TPA: hypothetical protein PLY93_14665 [Turneriella sp.]|nr:hypothetical protein [Turneriella sp.]